MQTVYNRHTSIFLFPTRVEMNRQRRDRGPHKGAICPAFSLREV